MLLTRNSDRAAIQYKINGKIVQKKGISRFTALDLFSLELREFLKGVNIDVDEASCWLVQQNSVVAIPFAKYDISKP